MLKNYFKTAFKVFIRNKSFTAINILGLSIGISASLIIFLIVHFEFSYDKIETDANRIYRVVMDLSFNGNEGHSAAVFAPLSSAIENELTGIEAVVPVMQFQGDATAKVSIESNLQNPVIFEKQPDIVFTSPSYFSLLPYEWIAGSPKSSLQNPFTVVLTESRAKEYFPFTNMNDIIGKQLHYNDDFTATVSGIVKDLNARTSFDAVEFISFATIAQTHMQEDFMINNWYDWMSYSQVYIKLASDNNAVKIEKQLNLLLDKYNKNADKDATNYIHLHMQPLNNVHFNSLYAGFNQRLANKTTLYELTAIGVFLLLLACINFINLTTANASSRAKEIGIRKTIGCSRKQLIFQFLAETFLLTVTACLISICLTPYLLELFADFMPPGLEFQPLQQGFILPFLILLALIVSFLSGFYPAFILSGYKPVNVLKKPSLNISRETRHKSIRKMLTVFQFVIAQFFVIAAVMVSKQINYSLNANMGFRKDAILSFDVPRIDKDQDNRNVLLNEIKALPGVQLVSRGFLTPADKNEAFTDIKYDGAANDVKENVQLRWGDTNYLRLFNIKILAGRNVQQSDTIKEFLINETYAKLLGFKHLQDALGKRLDFNGKKLPIVGIMKDFHEQSLHSPVGPLVFACFNSRSYFYHILLQHQNKDRTSWQKTIGQIKNLYHQLYPDADFNYKFLDDTIAHFYETEQRTVSLLSWATGLSILISCLGLYGLVMYTINTRTKEIGIRKVLGASITNIISIVSKEFVLLVLLAFVIASPIAWWAINYWLEDFAYRTAMSFWIFILCGLSMLFAALITLSIKTIKVAAANPVKSLRYE
jgi:putative ABC transport system permease protein